MRLWPRKREPEHARRDALEIMREATQLRNEMRITTDLERATVIEQRMRALAVEIGALPPDAVVAGEGSGKDA